jgi:cholesterol transport system auxiliary component
MRKTIYFIFILIFTLTAGCLSKKYPDKKQYAFDIPAPKTIKIASPGQILEIDNTTITPQFSSVNFTYRISAISYLTDYYNTFFSPPTQQIDQIITNYLTQTGLFRYVTNDDDYGQANYTLHAKVLELYADYRHKQNPRGIIAIQFTLFKQTELETTMIMDKTFREAVPLSSKDSQSLINAWTQGLEKILQGLTLKLCDTVESESLLSDNQSA